MAQQAGSKEVGVQKPDFENAKTYAINRLENELEPNLFFHSVAHTREHVVPAVERLAELEGVEGEDLLLLLTAAYFHDIGFVEQRDYHEAASVKIACKVLPDFGYSEKQLEIISNIIMATEIPQTPQTLLEKIMADADLDALGREDFFERNQDLRAETEFHGRKLTDAEWLEEQVLFLESHSYFTVAARTLRDVRKRENLDLLHKMVQQVETD